MRPNFGWCELVGAHVSEGVGKEVAYREAFARKKALRDVREPT